MLGHCRDSIISSRPQTTRAPLRGPGPVTPQTPEPCRAPHSPKPTGAQFPPKLRQGCPPTRTHACFPNKQLNTRKDFSFPKPGLRLSRSPRVAHPANSRRPLPGSRPHRFPRPGPTAALGPRASLRPPQPRRPGPTEPQPPAPPPPASPPSGAQPGRKALLVRAARACGSRGARRAACTLRDAMRWEMGERGPTGHWPWLPPTGALTRGPLQQEAPAVVFSPSSHGPKACGGPCLQPLQV